jgi:hypothetical protein
MKPTVSLLRALALLAPLAIADGGGISFNPEVKLFEPGQKAIVGWNGEIETMILSIDVRATGDTKAIEIVPFPSEPKFEKGDHVSFLYADYLVQAALEKLGRQENWSRFAGAEDLGGERTLEVPAIQVTTHKRIGPHDITAIKVNDFSQLASWLTDFFKAQGAARELPKGLDKVMNAYLDHGVRHFAIDVMDLSKETRTVDPIVYTFKTDRLWYPMQISSLYEGESEVTLITVTERSIKPETFPAGFAPMKVTVTQWKKMDKEKKTTEIALPPIKLEPARAKKLNSKIAELFGDKETVLSVWRYKGPLQVDFDVALKP